MVEAPSIPPNANATVDQKNTFFKASEGKMAPPPKCVAEPKRNHAVTPITISRKAGSHVPTAPTLCSHLPTFNPIRFNVKPSARPANAAPMKYGLFVDRCCQRSPPTNKALPAAKYNTPG